MAFFIISYDITNNRVRYRLARLLKDYGKRVQRSVFEANLGENRLARLRQRLSAVTLEKNDSIRVYRLCKDCLKTVQIWGTGQVTRKAEVYIL